MADVYSAPNIKTLILTTDIETVTFCSLFMLCVVDFLRVVSWPYITMYIVCMALTH